MIPFSFPSVRANSLATGPEILESKRMVLNERLKISLSAEGCFCGPLVAKLMEVSQ